MSYTSSIINKYGDSENVQKDCKTIFEILDRQGATFLIDALAEHVGRSVNRFKLDDVERVRLRATYVNEFHEAITERI